MKKLSETYKELGIAFEFPIEIKGKDGKLTYFEDSEGYWARKEYDKDSNETYFENSDDYWSRKEYDENGKRTYFENSDGYKEGTKKGFCARKYITINLISSLIEDDLMEADFEKVRLTCDLIEKEINKFKEYMDTHRLAEL